MSHKKGHVSTWSITMSFY